MKIKIKKIDNSIERQIAIGSIVSDKFIKDLKPIYDQDMIDLPFVRMIVDWCFEHFDKYQKSPSRDIEQIFEIKSESLDDSMAEMVETFLTDISSEFERAGKFNHKYVLDNAEKYFKVKSLRKLSSDIRKMAIDGDVKEAELTLVKYKRVERPSSKSINPFSNKDAIFKAFEEETEPLFKFPHALGEMINSELVRSGFVSLMGPEKRGKTWWLMELAMRAARERCNVAMFQVGDMTESQMIRRQCIRLVGKSDKMIYCGKFKIPVLDCFHNQTNSCKLSQRTCRVGIIDEENQMVDFEDVPMDYEPCIECMKNEPQNYKGTHWYEEKQIDQPLDWRDAFKSGKKFSKMMKGRDFKLSTHPNNTINVQGINSELDIWEHTEGFIPDVVVIDYADILAPEPGAREFRHQQNETWKMLRSMSQTRHCLVITATQADAKSYDADLMKMKHYSEDKRKYAHVTGMIGLNQTEDEKENGIMRLNWIVLREGEFRTTKTVKVLQSLRMGRPYLGSYA